MIKSNLTACQYKLYSKISFTLCIWLFMLLSAPVAFAQLTITKSVDKTDLLSGELFTYTLQYRCASTTTDCNNVTVTDVIPPGMIYNSLTGSVHTIGQTGTYDSATRTVTFDFIDPLPAGSTGELTITCFFPNGSTPDGATATNTATITDGTTDVVSNPVTVTPHATDQFCPSLGTQQFGALGSEMVYSITVPVGTGLYGAPTGMLIPEDITIVQQLLPGTTFVSAGNLERPANGGLPLVPENSIVGTYDATANTITWVIPNGLMGLSLGSYSGLDLPIRLTSTVIYSSPPFSEGDVVSTSATATCTLTVDSTVPTACSPATNTYNLAVTVSYADQPAGDITINVGGTNYTFTPDGTSPDTYTVTGLTSNGTTGIDVTATFVGDNACTDDLIDAYNAPASCSGCIPLPCYALHENPDDPNPGFPFYKNIGGTWTHVCNIMAAIPEIDAMVVKGDSIFLFNHTQVWVYVESSGTCSATAIGSYGGELTAVEGAALDLKTGTIYIHSGDQICKMNKQTGMAYECQTILTPENAPLGFDMADWRAEDVALNPCNGTFYMSGSVNNGVSDHIITWDPLTMTSNWIVELETVGGSGGSADGLSFNSCCELMSSDAENTYLVNQQTGLLTPADEVTSSNVDLESFDCLVPRPPLVNDDYITDNSCILPTCYSLALKANDEDMDTQMGLYDVTILLAPLGWTYNILDQVLGLVEFCPPIGISDGTYIFEYTLCKITPCCSNDATCSANASIVITLTNCNIVPCTLTVTSATPTACNPATNTYDLAVSVTYADQPAGDITINVGGTDYTVTPTAGSPETFTINNLPANGTADIDITATFVGDAACTHTLVDAYDAPASCACALTASANGTNVLCNGGTDGTATATAIGNTAAVTYAWSNGGTTANISNLAAGTYSVTISESASCTAVASYTVTEPAILDITCDKTDVTTNGGADGIASVSATGGTSPYTYLWNSGETTSSISGKTAGTYTVTVTDANGCTDACASSINEPGALCNLTGAGLAAVICNDSSTSADATDDYIGFTLNPTGTTLGSGYIVTVSSGSITPNTANYGSASNFQLQNGSAGSGNTITVTITDASDTNCKVQVDVSDPGSCSTPTCPPVKCLPISITKN